MCCSGDHMDNLDSSGLTADVLVNIFALLDTISDCINFRAVCSLWRYAAMETSTHNTHLPKQAPWLMIPNDRYGQDETHTILSLADGKAHTVHLPEICYREIKGSSHGWLILVDERQHNLILLQPITRKTIELPPVTTLDAETKLTMLKMVGDKENYLDRADFLVGQLDHAAISSSPSFPDNDWVVTVSVWCNSAIPFICYRKGSNKWIAAAAPAPLPWPYYGFESFIHYYNAENFICGKGSDGTFWAWRAEHPDATPFPLKMLLPSTSSLSRRSGQQQWYSVTWETVDDDDDDDDWKSELWPLLSLELCPMGYFEIHKLFIVNEGREVTNKDDPGEWNGLADGEACLSPCNDIGQNVLLVESCPLTMGVTAGSNFPSARSNCVYFLHDFEHKTYGLGVHDLKKKTTEWLLPRWKISSYSSTPFWFLPSFF